MTDWYFLYRCKIIRVVDGDTVDVAVDLGFDIKLTARFRMLGINAPEKNTEAGKASAARLAELLPVGSDVVVQTIKDKREKYGRYLGTFIVDKRDINKQMLDENLVVVMSLCE